MIYKPKHDLSKQILTFETDQTTNEKEKQKQIYSLSTNLSQVSAQNALAYVPEQCYTRLLCTVTQGKDN